MDMIEYEKYQLDMICAEYRQKGFDISKEELLPEIPFRFDAIARLKQDERSSLVVIEIVNSERPDRIPEERIEVFEKLAVKYPFALVDFRYIDANQKSWVSFARQRRQQRALVNPLDLCIKRRVPKPDNSSELAINKQFLELWGLHTMTLRSYAAVYLSEEVIEKGILDLYNQLLESRFLRPPEDLVSDVKLDLFEIYDIVQGAIQGASVTADDVAEIRGHVFSTRKQIRKRLNFGPTDETSAFFVSI